MDEKHLSNRYKSPKLFFVGGLLYRIKYYSYFSNYLFKTNILSKVTEIFLQNRSYPDVEFYE